MPIYEYKCSSCEEQLEVMQKISDPRLTVCPECGGELSKLISNTSFVLKGGGWYADGYSSSGAPEKAGTGQKDKKNGKKAETKPSSSGESPSAKDGKGGNGSSSAGKPASKAAASGA